MTLQLGSLIFLCLLFRTVSAYTRFDTVCPLPNSTFNFVASPNTRGTLDITWTCFATLLICVSSILHLNLPVARHQLKPSLQWAHSKTSWLLQPSLAIATLVAPEFVFGICLLEWWDARQQLKRLKSSSAISEVSKESWTATHMFYANMGGFVVSYSSEHFTDMMKDCDKQKDDSPSKKAAQIGEKDKESGSTAAVGAQPSSGAGKSTPPKPLHTRQEAQASEPSPTTSDKRSRRYRYHLNAAIFIQAVEEKIITFPSDVATEDITDRSKADWFAKLLAILQLLYFAINIIARLAEQLPITALEVATTAFAVPSVIVYAVLWDKPKNVTTTITVATVDKVPERVREMRRDYYERSGQSEESIKSGRPVLAIGIPAKANFYVAFGGMTIFAIVFGAIHVAGWNLDFPTDLDRWLWRASAITTAVLPLPASAVMLWLYVTPSSEPRPTSLARGSSVGRPPFKGLYLLLYGPFQLCVLIYGLGRLALIVEMIRLLFYLPPLAYATPNWPEIPHIG